MDVYTYILCMCIYTYIIHVSLHWILKESKFQRVDSFSASGRSSGKPCVITGFYHMHNHPNVMTVISHISKNHC